MSTEYNYISLGFDCSPAAALRGLNLREFALPFDWVRMKVDILIRCLKDDFKNFHKNLKFNYNKKMLVDHYYLCLSLWQREEGCTYYEYDFSCI